MKKKLLVISGPNLEASCKDIYLAIKQWASKLGVTVDCKQFNTVGDMIDYLESTANGYEGGVVNTGTVTDSESLQRVQGVIDKLSYPCIEVSTVHSREEHHSVASVCMGVVKGFGFKSYIFALEALTHSET